MVGGLVCTIAVLFYSITADYQRNVLKTERCEEKSGTMMVTTRGTVCINVESIKIK